MNRVRFPNANASAGFLAREEFYGGDGGTLPCGILLKDVDLGAEPVVYQRKHRYTCGVLRESQWFQSLNHPVSFKSLDLDVDCDSGLVERSRDTAGLTTTFDYDLLGRLTEMTPQAGQGAITTYRYDRDGTNNLPARVTIQQKDGSTVLTEEQVRFDGFGRVALERRKMPDGTNAFRHTLWSSRGWMDQRSEWEGASDGDRSWTLFRQYDPFGRPGAITLPDDRQITLSYDGVSSRTITVPIATSLGATGEPVLQNTSTTETYDRFGRLIQVHEPNSTPTHYSYDALGNLTEVRVNAGRTPQQARFFSYDHRGLLRSESHPELGTSVLYQDYDALGNPRRIQRGGWGLAHSYDDAGRLTEVRERGTDRVWKRWEYATGNFQAGQWSRGKLKSASRHNRVLVPGTTFEIDPVVTETYTYDGVGGRISQVRTAVSLSSHPVFHYGLSYDALGNVASRSYPECSDADPFDGEPFFCTQVSFRRTVSQTFSQGLLAAIPGHASAVTYHPNGTYQQVTHANGVLDLQEKDPDDLARPRRLRTSGASETFDTGVYAFDGAGNVTEMGTHRYVYDLLSRVKEAQVEVPGEGCGDTLSITSGTETGIATRESCGTVEAGGSYGIGSTGDVTLRAGNRVVLTDGFSAASGGRLTLETDPALDPGGGATEASQSYGHDLFGNLLSVTTEREGQSPATRTIGTNASNNRLSVATYDTSGNVTSWAGRSFAYDPFNMLWQTTASTSSGYTFVYGPDDERLWTIDWSAGTASSNWVETWTLRDLDGSPLRQFRTIGGNGSGNWRFHRDYVWRGGALLAAETPEGRRHFHLDHLGTPRLVTDASRTALAKPVYFPFGEEVAVPPTAIDALQFTGHERDDLDAGGTTADFDYMHARYFSAHLGRFHSVDPLGVAPEWPQSWNRYSYVLGNPMKYTDPRGLIWEAFQQIPNPFLFFGQTTSASTNVPLFFSVLGLLSGPSSSSSFSFALFAQTPAPAAPPQWVNPTGGCIRACDSFGCGGFGASRDGGSRRHMGTDFLATPSQDVLAPTSGTLTRAVNRVYRTAPHFSGFVLSGQNGYTMKAFYVATDPSLIGTQVTAGDVLGTAQDLGLRYSAGMSNHVHLQIRDPQGQFIDPATVIPNPAGCP